MLESEDFNDDRKDTGELGAGRTITAEGDELMTLKVRQGKNEKVCRGIYWAANAAWVRTLPLSESAGGARSHKLSQAATLSTVSQLPGEGSSAASLGERRRTAVWPAATRKTAHGLSQP